jgi:hypothetical protein
VLHGSTSPRLTTDAPRTTSEATRAQIYAAGINSKGAEMRGRSCREPLLAAEHVNWPVFMMDSTAADQVNGYDDALEYSRACRKLHRQK